MTQYVSRRRRCWNLLTTLDPDIHLSDGHRADMLLDLAGIDKDQRIMVQASIGNARNYDKVAEALLYNTHEYIFENPALLRPERAEKVTVEVTTSTHRKHVNIKEPRVERVEIKDFDHAPISLNNNPSSMSTTTNTTNIGNLKLTVATLTHRLLIQHTGRKTMTMAKLSTKSLRNTMIGHGWRLTSRRRTNKGAKTKSQIRTKPSS